MSSKSFRALLSGSIGILAVGLASAGTLAEYNSLAAWNAAVSNVSSYRISQLTTGLGGETTPPEVLGGMPVSFGPGVFTGDTGSGVIYNDGVYGTGIQYFSDDPRANGQHNAIAAVTVAFGAPDDISALAFDLGAGDGPSDIDISVNGSALAPIVVSSLFPTMFLGVSDTKGPITSVTFSAVGNNAGEMDVINGFQTAHARPTAAPELSSMAAPAALTLLFGLLAVLEGRRRAARHAGCR
ncbi:MAG TPA: hypothetical protein VGG63_11720 [Steroidobacteraceae bacterium]|jgi:hypothetical protein